MKLKFLSLILNYTIYALTILLVFFVIFENYLELPQIVGWLGRWHPLLLHFPIVLIFIAIIQYWRKDKAANWYLTAATLFTLLSALTGFILSIEGDSKGNLILTHQWLGISVTIFMVIWYFFSAGLKSNPLRVLHVAMTILIVLTGHFGGMVTHGEDFLAFGGAKEKSSVALTGNPNIYTHLVQPVFDEKCVSCHNENKAKGKLILTEYNALAMGGESGSMTGQDSEILHRILLPADHEDHMPPAKEKQLTKDELMILQRWLELGAEERLQYSDLDPQSELADVVKQMLSSGSSNDWLSLPSVSDAELEKLGTDYCTIRRMHRHSNALQVLVFPHNPYDFRLFQNLKKISKNVVELSLLNVPLSKEEMKVLGFFNSLEMLNIRDCSFSDDDFNQLEGLNNLKVLKASNTTIGDMAISGIQNFTQLTQLYAYNTKLTESGVEKLKSKMPNLQVTTHVDEADGFSAILPAPVMEPARFFFCEPFFIAPKHPLNDVEIKYTIDGDDSGSRTLLANDSLLIDKNMSLQFFAAKDGWESSAVDSIKYFSSCIKPESFSLGNPPDAKYKGKGNHLLFDLEKGPLSFGDEAWMGFRDQDFILNCEFENPISLSGFTLSSIVHTDPHLFPPQQIRIYGGMQAGELRLLATEKSSVPKDRQGPHYVYYQYNIPVSSVQFIRIVVEPLRNIPLWHQGKGERAWFFIDEIIFESAVEL